MKVIIPPLWEEWMTVSKRLKIAYGGRSSSKSYTIALMLLILGTTKTLRILCAREYQNSLKESVYANLKEICADINGLGYFYEFKRDSVVGKNGTTFMFAGLQNPDSIKSMSGINYVWIEEGQSISERSWEILEPTIRPSKAMVKNNEPCEIWVSMNPDSIDDVLYKLISSGRDDMLTLYINYMDNPFNPEIMLKLAQQTKEENEDKYNHVWLGHPRSSSDSIIYAGRWEELDFEIDNYNGVPQFKDEIIELRYGFDWGFSNPSAVIECFVHDRCLYIHNEIYKRNMSAEDITAALKKHMKQAFNPSSLRTGDSNNPGMISQLSKFREVDGVEYEGIDITPAKKGDGSVKEGINFIKDGLKRIYVHPRCVNTIHELKTYSYKLDKDGNPTDHVRKENDHLCFSGDTLVEVNGIVQRIDSIPESGFVSSVNGDKVKYSKGGYIKDSTLIELVLDNGECVKCTKDHLIMTKHGWKQAFKILFFEIYTNDIKIYDNIDSRQKLFYATILNDYNRKLDLPRVVRIKELGVAKTYCLTTERGYFSLANGLIVSNCDSLRYAVESLTLSYYSDYSWVKDVDIEEFEENNNFIY